MLKRDVFSTVERGRFEKPTATLTRYCAGSTRFRGGPIFRRAICSRASATRFPWRATCVSGRNCCGPAPSAGARFIDGVALHQAKPFNDVAYFRSAKLVLHKLHSAGICHNDLAKEQNWLVGRDGQAYLTDFQLAACFRTRGRLFRIAAYEDLRHL